MYKEISWEWDHNCFIVTTHRHTERVFIILFMKQGLSTDFSIYGIMLALRKFGVWEVFRLVLLNLYCTWRILPEAHLYPVNFPPWMRSVTGMLLREIYITMRPTSNPKNLGGRGKWITVSSSQGQPGLQSEFQDKTVQKKKSYGPGEVTLWLYCNNKNYGKEKNCYFYYY